MEQVPPALLLRHELVPLGSRNTLRRCPGLTEYQKFEQRLAHPTDNTRRLLTPARDGTPRFQRQAVLYALWGGLWATTMIFANPLADMLFNSLA